MTRGHAARGLLPAAFQTALFVVRRGTVLVRACERMTLPSILAYIPLDPNRLSQRLM